MFLRIWTINEVCHQIQGPTAMCYIENNKERGDPVRELLPQLLMNDGAKQPHRTLASFELLILGESSELSIYLPSPDFSHSVCMKLGCMSTVSTFWSVTEFIKTVSSSKIILPRDSAPINVRINIFKDVYTTVTSANDAFFQNISLPLSHTCQRAWISYVF